MSDPHPLETFRAEPVLEGLHGFQRDAVEYAFDRLFRTADSSRRFLVADEVGLGKTLIARGVLAKALEFLRGKVARIDVVYICSNRAIAAQNIDRLNPLPDLKFADAERITLLPVHADQLDRERINFVAFTPGTSLNLGDNLGTARERILLYLLLRRHWNLQGTAPLNMLQGHVQDFQSFRERVANFEARETISNQLAQEFFAALDAQAELRDRFLAVCARFTRPRAKLPEEDRLERRAIVGRLRSLLASTCINALQPDLVILDEFQRFRDLLNPETDQGELAHQLFRWAGGDARAHVLLLSATPYKAYTLQHEAAEEDHYDDFLRTVAFLDDKRDTTASFERLLREYRNEMYRLRESDGAELRELKTRIERHLRRVMSRTERLSAGTVVNGMVRTVTPTSVRVSARDLRAYGALRRLSDELDVGDSIEYWKSAAYAINFMEGYELRRALDDRTQTRNVDSALGLALEAASSEGLQFDTIARYGDLSPVPNARARAMLDDVVKLGAIGPLWLPPSLPYYRLEGPFVSAVGLTKRLVFSAWNMVPRSLAAVLSYQAERQAFVGDEESPRNSPDARKARRGLLRFSESEGRLTGLPVFTLLYPSDQLAEACDPRTFRRAHAAAVPDAGDVMRWAEGNVRKLLPSSVQFAERGQSADERWYWLAPMLLDANASPAAAQWWHREDLHRRWGVTDATADDDGGDIGWRQHVDLARDLVRTGRWPEGRAPHDLVEVLALIGVAGPATCALRSLGSLFADDDRAADVQRDAAAAIGWGFRSLYNRQESIALVRRRRRDTPYWQLALEHGREGCIAATLDEYLHILRDARGLTNARAADACPNLAQAVLEALQVRTATLEVDEPHVDRESRRLGLRRHSMRTLFAMRFGGDKSEDEQRVRRDTAVSAAFNSPFWPFVLATTSVGQEGLDFHWYCHAVVHWNLPSNPVDLEQREGRIHRFKGHAVRKNVAQVHGAAALRSGARDLWKEIFARASGDAPAGDRGLVPYWLYPLENGAWIERRVPMYPLSRDEARYHALQRSLAAYRMVFGQPRQDELLAYLMNQVDTATLAEWSKVLTIDISPPRFVQSMDVG